MKELFTEINGHLLISMIQDLVHKGATPMRTKAVIKAWITNNPDIGKLLGIMYNPLIKFNYKLHHEEFFVDYENMENEDFPKVGELLEALYTKEVSKRTEKEHRIEELLSNNTLLALFLRKNLDLGFGVSSAKDLGIISQHSPQKGVLADLSKVRYPLIADFKYNGSRLSVINTNGEVVCKLLKGNIIDIPILQIMFAQFKDFTFDGEIVYTGNTPEGISYLGVGGITETDRIEVAGRITSATANNTALVMKDLHFVIYDLLATKDFVQAKASNKTYGARREMLQALVPEPTKTYSLSTIWKIAKEEELEALIAWNKAIGGEGFMLKTISSTYDYKKNSSWLKVKHFKEADFKIVGYETHSRNSKWIGSLTCYAIIDNKQVLVQVGSGLNDMDRPINKFPEYKDKVVMVTYMDMVKNRLKKGVYSVTNPRFAKDRVDRRLSEIIRLDGNNINA